MQKRSTTVEPDPLSSSAGFATPVSRTEGTRRRWLVRVTVFLVLMVGVMLAWPFRPLNGTERRLVGAWHLLGDRPQFLRFTADRRLRYAGGSEPFEEIGTWSAAESGLEIRFHADQARIAKQGWLARLEELCGRLRGRKPSVLKFHGGDRALIYGYECERIAE